MPLLFISSGQNIFRNHDGRHAAMSRALNGLGGDKDGRCGADGGTRSIFSPHHHVVANDAQDYFRKRVTREAWLAL